MANERICVVGASGFVGSHVAARLLQRGYSVTGTLRDASAPASGWLHTQVAPLAEPGCDLHLASANLQDADSLEAALAGCDGVIMCAGVEQQSPETIELMVGGAEALLDRALASGITRAVFTSSTGSTNPPDGEPALKNEIDHWSSAEQQQAAGKFSPAAKTLMDRTVLAKMHASDGQLRTCTINPSLIVGPGFQPEPVNSLKLFQAIVQKRRHVDRAPNSSMSMIDVRDLADLHISALENSAASGRYFGVKQSWHWQDILEALARVHPAYEYPAFPAAETRLRPTQFDLRRQQSLGCELRDLDAMIDGVVQELLRRDML